MQPDTFKSFKLINSIKAGRRFQVILPYTKLFELDALVKESTLIPVKFPMKLNHMNSSVDFKKLNLKNQNEIKRQLQLNGLQKIKYDIKSIFNSDQSKMEYEMTTGITLAQKGVKEVTRACESENATTHTYTFMVLVSTQLIS